MRKISKHVFNYSNRSKHSNFSIYDKLNRVCEISTQIHGCLSASVALIRLAGFTVNIELMRFFASAVTVSHSGDGYLLDIVLYLIIREVFLKKKI